MFDNGVCMCDIVSSNTSFNKEELNAILKFGAEELFKETEEDDELQVGFTSKMSPPLICSSGETMQAEKQLNLFVFLSVLCFYVVSHLTSIIFSQCVSFLCRCVFSVTTELRNNVQMIDVVVSLTSMTFCEWPSSVT